MTGIHNAWRNVLLDDTQLFCPGHGFRAVICAQLGEYTSKMKFNSAQANVKSLRNFFIGHSLGNQL